MDPAASLNAALERGHPAAARCLSDLGGRLFYPRGVPAQSAEAAGCDLNATIGEMVGDDGEPAALDSMRRHVVGLPPAEVFLYAAQGGRKDLRQLWLDHILQTEPAGLPRTLPVVAGGLTHGLSVTADLFADAATDVLLPSPGWGNYDHIFGTRRGARLVRYPAMDLASGKLDAEGLRAALAQAREKAVVVLNFPSNPVGYSPAPAEADALCAVLRETPVPTVVVCDDAYHGMVWEEGLEEGSLFSRLADADPERLLAVQVDGATKELLFFGGRIAFVTFGANGEAGKALEEKARAILRATTSSVSAVGQALVMSALRDPDLHPERAARLEVLRRRYSVLKAALDEEKIGYWPFNSAFFALVPTPGDPEALRVKLLAEGIGTISVPSAKALRLSYSTLPEHRLPELVARLAPHLKGA